MAQKGHQPGRERFCCSICLDLLNDPVTVPCGHSYCRNCIKGHWGVEDEKGIYSCPQCREVFTPRPVLGKNTMLADLVEELKNTSLQTAPADGSYAGPEDVPCDFCIERKLKALKSCLQCVASYCDEHLQPHFKVAALKRHKLVEPSKKLQENVCARHDEVMKMFCRTDQQSICYLCLMGEHKGHDTVSAEAERTKWQKELEERRQTFQQEIQDREKDVKLLQKEVESINCSADKAVEHSDKIFTLLISFMEKTRSDVRQQVRSLQETEVSRAKELQKKLELEITQLKRRDSELYMLSQTEDHIQFLHDFPSVSAFSEPTHISIINTRPLSYFKDVTAAVSEVTEMIRGVLTEKWTNICHTEVDVLLPHPQPETRADFIKYSCDITLDPKTLNEQLVLRNGNKKVEFVDSEMSYSSHPDRFTDDSQVLSRESLTGRCYWEVERRGKGAVSVAVAYKNIRRGGFTDECRFGLNDKSWALVCFNNKYRFKHNKVITRVSGPRSSKIGVYLDHRGGTLSFYSISETMSLLHRVQTTFTQPLHAGVRFALSLFDFPVGETVEFCELK